jgi:hypothetical protein
MRKTGRGKKIKLLYGIWGDDINNMQPTILMGSRNLSYTHTHKQTFARSIFRRQINKRKKKNEQTNKHTHTQSLNPPWVLRYYRYSRLK